MAEVAVSKAVQCRFESGPGHVDDHKIHNARELRLYLKGWDDASTTFWRTLGDLVRAGASAETIVYIVQQNQSGKSL